MRKTKRRKKKAVNPVGRPRKAGNEWEGNPIAKAVQAKREKLGLKVDDVSVLCGVSRTQLYQVESGAVDPSKVELATLVKIERGLGFAKSELILISASLPQ